MAENVDSSYYTGGNTGIGTYLGQDYNRSGYYVPSWIKSDKEDVRGSDPYAQIALNPGTMYRLVDYSGENEGTVLGQGSTAAEIAAMQKIINEQLVPLGRKADWRIQEVSNAPIDPATGLSTYTTGSSVDPETGQYYTTLGGDYYNKPSVIGPIADIALPLAMNFLIPGSGLLHGALTAAGGSILSGVAQGKPIGDIAKGALISGIGGGIGGSFGGAGVGGSGSAVGGATGATSGALGSGIGSALGGVADDAIINVLANSLGSGVGGAIGSGVGGALGSALTSGGGYQAQPGDAPLVTGTGYRYPISSGAPGLAAGLSGVGAQAVADILAKQAAQQAAQEQADRQPEDTIVVTAPPKPFIPSWALPAAGVAGLAGLTGFGGAGAATTPTQYQPQPGETVGEGITVTASPEGGLIIPPAVPSAPPPDLSLFPEVAPLTVSPVTLPPTTQPRTLSDYINMVRGGIGVAGGIAGLFGGGGDDKGKLPPGFNANAGTVNYTPLARTQNVIPFDPFTYGQATGERSFFNPYELQYQTNVPAKAAPAFKDGGEAESVKGIANSPPLSLEKVLEKNKNLPFVQRILYPQQSPVAIDDEDSEGKRVMTHKMEWGEADGNYYAYPRVMEDESGKLKDYKGSAFKEASRRGDILKMQTPEQADWFTKNYKSYWDSIGFVPQETKSYSDGGEAEFDDSIEGHLASYYSGGGHAGPGPVKGIGSGQEDKIPAWLSDGEYVWSAQDVADLGDGSTNEGVRRLDKMRQMVRKGAGRKDTKSIARPQKGIDSMLKAVGGAA
jgi:hypothetical protein